ncbi:M23 family metallopeptidase [Flexibacterium corallicola]|uniref:M23 family metallopeptidase n=1 Tax=Flexibacterium corallicola TaxID=3037259 RepID=UPI00286F306C|nr:M23 family metallopeptidase [Pseudovibrio sp. M1P-2-3]
MAALTLSLVFLSLTFMASTAYFYAKGSILSASLRQKNEKLTAYKDHIISLRGQVAQLTSAQSLSTHKSAQFLEELLKLQKKLELRHQKVEDLIGLAHDKGLLRFAKITHHMPLSQTDPSKDILGQPSSGIGGIPVFLDDEEEEASLAGPDGQQEHSQASPPLHSGVQHTLQRQGMQAEQALDFLYGRAERNIYSIMRLTRPIHKWLPQASYTPKTGHSFEDKVSRAKMAILFHHVLINKLDNIPLAAPLTNTALTSKFGRRIDPFLRRPAFHTGLDFKAPTGTKIMAPANGKVIFSGWKRGYGRTVFVRHANGIETRYAHLRTLLVMTGDTLKKGEILGLVGSSGRSTGPHLHYETRVNGKAIDPMPLIRTGQEIDTILKG